MTFTKALEALKAGYKVKLPHWKGYWVKENDTVKMYCKNGDVLDIRETEDVFYTLSNIASDEWGIVEETNIDLNVKTFCFGEAIRLIKQGKKVARKGWNGKSQYIELATNISYRTANGEVINAEHNAIGNKAIGFVGTSGVQLGWLASQADMLAEDWITVD
ncbi:MAG: DUF2829 domain-containing protein [Acutalibacteraceae bacterium]|nr:DUF2829 domain-containing protein [Acutalibacteraceae bacterium]